MRERPTDVRALLFDLDGTIVDTGELHYRASVETLAEFGISIERDTYDRVIHGNSNENIASYFFPDGDAVKQARYVEMKECAFRASLGAVAPMPGLFDVLDWAEANGIGTAVVTNAPRENTDAVLHALDLEMRFAAVILGDDLERGKPDPLPYEVAMQRLGVVPEAAVGFEDSTHGVHALKAAGVYAFGVTTGFSADRLLADGADAAIPDFRAPALWEHLKGA